MNKAEINMDEYLELLEIKKDFDKKLSHAISDYDVKKTSERNILSTENLFAYAFEPTRNVSSEAVYQEGLPVYLSFDFNVNPATCAVFQHTHDFIYQIDEIRLKDSSIYSVTDLIKTKEYFQIQILKHELETIKNKWYYKLFDSKRTLH